MNQAAKEIRSGLRELLDTPADEAAKAATVHDAPKAPPAKVVDRSSQTLIVTAAYYAFRHFSQYIAPGATRVAISGSNDALAFKNPDGSVVTEVYNSGDSAQTISVAASGKTYQFDVPAHGWATLRTTP